MVRSHYGFISAGIGWWVAVSHRETEWTGPHFADKVDATVRVEDGVARRFASHRLRREGVARLEYCQQARASASYTAPLPEAALTSYGSESNPSMSFIGVYMQPSGTPIFVASRRDAGQQFHETRRPFLASCSLKSIGGGGALAGAKASPTAELLRGGRGLVSKASSKAPHPKKRARRARAGLYVSPAPPTRRRQGLLVFHSPMQACSLCLIWVWSWG